MFKKKKKNIKIRLQFLLYKYYILDCITLITLITLFIKSNGKPILTLNRNL